MKQKKIRRDNRKKLRKRKEKRRYRSLRGARLVEVLYVSERYGR